LIQCKKPPQRPIVKKIKYVLKQLQFAKEHIDYKWCNILWTDESKRVLFGSKVKMIKHGGSSIMIWGCFSYYGKINLPAFLSLCSSLLSL
uniref:Transposase Tc1-like domain-containing protein n=1 Tax=Poecilia reticulata TaxID=8081 RepID=A0A3P9QC63_POERE